MLQTIPGGTMADDDHLLTVVRSEKIREETPHANHHLLVTLATGERLRKPNLAEIAQKAASADRTKGHVITAKETAARFAREEKATLAASASGGAFTW